MLEVERSFLEICSFLGKVEDWPRHQVARLRASAGFEGTKLFLGGIEMM